MAWTAVIIFVIYCQPGFNAVYMYFTQYFTAIKSMPANTSNTIRNRDARQTVTAIECIVAYTSYSVRDHDTRQTVTNHESMATNTGHTVWDRDARQA